MTLVLGIVASILSLMVATYSATQEKLPWTYKVMIWVAAIATIIQSVWVASEQETFEKQVLGGDSYVYLIFEPVGESTSKFALRHGGERYPVYDLELEIYDLRTFEGIGTGDPREIVSRRLDLRKAAFGPNLVSNIFNGFHPKDCYGYWLGISQRRNGQVMNLVFARKVGGKWLSATRVFSVEGTEQTLVREYSQPGWEEGSTWPTVTIPEIGSLQTVTPKISCITS